MIFGFMGKGGVGKTTCSVEFARYLQSLKRSPLIVSIDRQNNALDYVKQMGYNLDVIGTEEIGKTTEMVEFIIANTFLDNFRQYVPIIVPDFVNVCALADLMHNIRAGQRDIVIDFPPNHAGLSIVNMPNVLHNMAFKTITIKNRVRQMIKGEDKALDYMNHLWDVVKEFKADMLECCFIPVGIPTYLSYLETCKLVDYLHVNNYQVSHAILNMIPDGNSSCWSCIARTLKAEIYLQDYDRYYNEAKN